MKRVSSAILGLFLVGILFWGIWSLMSQAPFSIATRQLSGDGGAEIGQADLSQTATATVKPLPTIDSPLPTPPPRPTGELTINDYAFSVPKTKFTRKYGVPVIEWLPDSRRAIIVADELGGLQTLDVTTGVTKSYGYTGPTYPKVVWFDSVQKMAFLQTTPNGIFLNISGGITEKPIVPATARLLRDAIAGQDDRVMVLEIGAQMPRMFDSDGNELSLPAIDLHKYGLNPPEPYELGPFMQWHPSLPKVAIWGKQGFIVFDIQSGEITSYDLDAAHGYWAISARWSPNGRKIALALAQNDIPFNMMWLRILDITTGSLETIPLSLHWISDIAWSPNSRQMAVGGHRILQSERLFEVYLVDTHTKEFRKIPEVSEGFLAGYRDAGLTWSKNGRTLLYSCIPAESTVDFGICESLVTVREIR